MQVASQFVISRTAQAPDLFRVMSERRQQTRQMQLRNVREYSITPTQSFEWWDVAATQRKGGDFLASD